MDFFAPVIPLLHFGILGRHDEGVGMLFAHSNRRRGLTVAILWAGGWYWSVPTEGLAEPPAISVGRAAESGERIDHGGILLADRRSSAPRSESNSEGADSPGTYISAKGTSSDKVKKAAVAAVPLDQMTPAARQRAEAVLEEMSYFRRLPTVVHSVEPPVYRFFVSHPDVAVSIWRALEISQLRLWQTGAREYEGDAGDGTVGIIDVLYQTPDKTVIICEGSYKSPLLKKPIKAKSLLLLETEFTRDADGSSSASHRADLFVTFPSQTVETVAKVLSPVTGPMVDRNFTEISLFLKMMSLAMTRRPSWVEQLAPKLDGITERSRTELLKVTSEVYSAEAKRLEANYVNVNAAAGQATVPATAEKSAQQAARR
jgi:hypothetical protein